MFNRQIDYAIDDLRKFFVRYSEWLREKDDGTKLRPYNGLLLGSPGSGKSFIAEHIAKSITVPDLNKPAHHVINISQCTSAYDIVQQFNQVGRWRAELVKYRPLVVTVDEFDSKIGGGSAIQNMIAPMYDGKDAEHKPLHGVAFVFTGSYLRNKRTLARIRKTPARVNLVKLFLDLYLGGDDEGVDAGHAKEMLSLALEFEKQRSDAPQDDVVRYLRGLEKIDDFLSRINGFTLEVPDIDEPLACTTDPFATAADPRTVRRRNLMQECSATSAVVDQVKRYARAQDRMIRKEHRHRAVFAHPYDPVFRYKNMLLRERLYKALHAIARLKKPESEDLRIRRTDLVYLCAVPLANGMRSLESIIDSCLAQDPADRIWKLSGIEDMRKHAREASPGSGSPHTLWVQLTRRVDQYRGQTIQRRGGDAVEVRGFKKEFPKEKKED